MKLDTIKIIRPDEAMPEAFRRLDGQSQMHYWQAVIAFGEEHGLTEAEAEAAYQARIESAPSERGELAERDQDLLRLEVVDSLLDDHGIEPLPPEHVDELLAERHRLEVLMRYRGKYTDAEHGRQLFDPSTLTMIDPMTVTDPAQHRALSAQREEQHRTIRYLFSR